MGEKRASEGIEMGRKKSIHGRAMRGRVREKRGRKCGRVRGRVRGARRRRVRRESSIREEVESRMEGRYAKSGEEREDD